MYDTFRFLIGLSKLKEIIIEDCIKFSCESEFSRQVNCILNVTCIISAEIQYKSRKKQVNKSEVTSIKIFQIIGRVRSKLVWYELKSVKGGDVTQVIKLFMLHFRANPRPI